LLGPVDGRAADAHAGRDIIVAGPCIGGQQYLRPLELARRMPASAQKRREFPALGLAELDPISTFIRTSSSFEARTNS
jgi:hypothetical protein